MRSIFIACCLCATSWAQAYAPMVTMSIRMPNGQVKELTAPESGLATADVGGQEYGFRPTMYDDKGNHITVTIFRLPDTEVGEVETGVGKPAAESKTSPNFRIRVANVAANQS